MGQRHDYHLEGTRIRMIKMDDPNPIEPGTEGTIDHVDGMNHYHVKWDNGRHLAVIPDEDKFELLNQ